MTTSAAVLDTAADGRLYAYISADGEFVTDWHGRCLGNVMGARRCNLPRWSYVHGSYWFAYRVLVDGRRMYGRGSPGICITLRPYK